MMMRILMIAMNELTVAVPVIISNKLRQSRSIGTKKLSIFITSVLVFL